MDMGTLRYISTCPCGPQLCGVAGKPDSGVLSRREQQLPRWVRQQYTEVQVPKGESKTSYRDLALP